MIDGLGVAGWGVGGIEAEAAMLGQVKYILTSKKSFRYHGTLFEPWQRYVQLHFLFDCQLLWQLTY